MKHFMLQSCQKGCSSTAISNSPCRNVTQQQQLQRDGHRICWPPSSSSTGELTHQPGMLAPSLGTEAARSTICQLSDRESTFVALTYIMDCIISKQIFVLNYI